LLSIGLALPAQADGFRDPEDGEFDISDYLLHRKGVMPVPIIITEPAVGYGGGVMLLYFSESLAEAGKKAREEGAKMAPPNITGIGAMGTENGTRGAGLFHFRTWDADGKINLDYYGLLDKPRSYEINGIFLVQQLLMKVGDSNWYVGPRYTYMTADINFTGDIATELGATDIERKIGKLGLVVDYDSRDNMFYPSKGSYAEIEAQFARDAFGSSKGFDNYRARAYTWLPLSSKWVLGLRGDVETTQGDVPFYAQPFIDLRGVSKGRYQDQTALVAEAELRWNITNRWAMLGFGGVGKAYGNWHTFDEADTVTSIGTGFRYLIARQLGLSVGIDIAHSKGEDAFYIQVGSAWR
jgi:hypothetical protein